MPRQTHLRLPAQPLGDRLNAKVSMARKAKKKPASRPKRSPRGRRLKKPPVLVQKTQRLIGRIGEQIQGTFLAYWTSEKGSICENDVQAMYDVLRVLQLSGRATLFVKSSGGDGQSSLRIIHLLRQHVDHLTVVVPLACASAATMLALGADEIHMGPLAYLTPIDTSLEHSLGPLDRRNETAFVGDDELHRVITLWEKHSRGTDVNPFQEVYKYIHPLVIGAVDRATSLSIRLCTEILCYHMEDKEAAQRIAHGLNADHPAHEYPITAREAKRMGLKVHPLAPELNEALLELSHMYSEMGQRAVTDFDEFNYHNNEIVNIIEGPGIQLFFQNNEDWHYRTEDKQWMSLNAESCWQRMLIKNGRVQKSKLFMS